MQFRSLVLAGSLAVLASATPSPAETSSAASTDPVQQCLSKCNSGDVNCQAHCITVPSPNEDQVNATTKCAMDCKQGDGSPAAIDAYGQCLLKCTHDHYYASSVGTPEATGAPGSGSGSSGSSGSSSGSSGSSGSSSGSSGASGSSSGSSGSSGSGSGSGSSSSAGSAAATGGSAASSGATGTSASKPSQTSGTASAASSSSAAAPIVGSTVFGLFAAIFAL